MNINEAKARAVNPGAFSHGDKWLIVDNNGRPLESHRDSTTAHYFCSAVNDHEARVARECPGLRAFYTYTVQEVTP